MNLKLTTMLVVPGFLFGISLQQIGETHSYTGRIVRNRIVHVFGPIKTQHKSFNLFMFIVQIR